MTHDRRRIRMSGGRRRGRHRRRRRRARTYATGAAALSTAPVSRQKAGFFRSVSRLESGACLGSHHGQGEPIRLTGLRGREVSLPRAPVWSWNTFLAGSRY